MKKHKIQLTREFQPKYNKPLVLILLGIFFYISVSSFPTSTYASDTANLAGEAENVGDLFGFWNKIDEGGRVVDSGTIASGAQKAAKGADDAIESAESIFSYEERKLQHEWKHAKKFGIEGNYNKEKGELFKNAIDSLRTSKNTLSKPGTFRGLYEGTHYYNPNTKLWAFYDVKRNFIAARQLSPEQYDHLIKTGIVKN